MASTHEEQQQRVLVKCGGFSTQLANHVGERIDGDPLWGSRFDLVNPTAVVQTHLDFLENGAQIILSNTYQSSVEGFMKHLKLSKEDSIQLMRKSVQLAKEARDKYIEKVEKENGSLEAGLPLILGSVGPYGAMLHDGSEYNGSYTDKVSKEEIQNWHRIRINALLAENVNGLAVETIPCPKEAEAVTQMILNDYPNVKFWVSFQCKDELHLAHGENFANAAKSIWDMVKQANARERIFGIGVNCVNPKFVAPLFKSLHVLLDDKDLPPLVVYSNRGETYDLEKDEWVDQDKCVPLETYVPEWIRLGATVIGGCCRVYPADILNIRKCIDSLGNNNI
ncbi:homocysteine S-methyltransferase 1-like [Lucilia cuprina]|uniref:homocysteine S-methyltransferase 1-like n=1 Tax=Lucilia cuprina TaxID=7375 RepID=UPI001F05AC5D|nr:homocysteine S-methyltransferase 1-like [Lucilia cuprina]